jgi:hypothetical protein
MIFRLASNIPGELDTSVPGSLQNPPRAWDDLDFAQPIVTRRVFTLVSKQWNLWASDLLYSHVRLHGLELGSLVQTVTATCESSPQNPLPRATRYTQRLKISLSARRNEDKFANLGSILSFCPNLSILHISVFSHDNNIKDVFSTIHRPSNLLRYIGFRRTNQMDYYVRWFPFLPLLEVLDLDAAYFSTIDPDPPISLPNLHTLMVYDDALRFDMDILALWDLPVLQNIRFSGTLVSKSGVHPFFNMYGHQIKMLDVEGTYTILPGIPLSKFPNLVDLHISSLTRGDLTHFGPHSTLTLLQIWLPVITTGSAISFMAHIHPDILALTAVAGPQTTAVRIVNWEDLPKGAIASRNGEVEGLRSWVESWAKRNVRLECESGELISDSALYREVVG